MNLDARDTSNDWYLSFDLVQKCFRNRRIFSSPLLMPVNDIERILKEDSILHEDERLGSYDINKESFKVEWIYDLNRKLKLRDKIKFWLIKRLS